jgi:ribosomal protein L22
MSPEETPADEPQHDATESAPQAAKPARARKAAKAKDDSEKPAAEKATSEKAASAKKPAAKKAPAAKEPTAAKKAAAAEKPAAKKAAVAEKPAVEKAVEQKAEQAAAPRSATKGAGKTPRRRVVRAHARYVRTSARKARMVCGHLRGKSVQEARAILAFTPREVARDWSKLLESAVANVESNHELLEDDLIVQEAYADEGPTIKRFRPRAMGRATPIRKRTSHLTITLTPSLEPGKTKRHG